MPQWHSPLATPSSKVLPKWHGPWPSDKHLWLDINIKGPASVPWTLVIIHLWLDLYQRSCLSDMDLGHQTNTSGQTYIKGPATVTWILATRQTPLARLISKVVPQWHGPCPPDIHLQLDLKEPSHSLTHWLPVRSDRTGSTYIWNISSMVNQPVNLPSGTKYWFLLLLMLKSPIIDLFISLQL